MYFYTKVEFKFTKIMISYCKGKPFSKTLYIKNLPHIEGVNFDGHLLRKHSFHAVLREHTGESLLYLQAGQSTGAQCHTGSR